MNEIMADDDAKDPFLDSYQHYGNRMICSDVVGSTSMEHLFDHTDASWIELRGPEAKFFLHNLATNDVRNLPIGGGCELFLTNHKARVLGHGVVGCYEADTLLLEVDPGRNEAVFKHLDRHLISERVELADRSAERGRLTLLGSNAAERIEKITGMTVADLKTWEHRPTDAILGVRWHVRRQGFVSSPGFDFIVPKDKIPTLRDAFADVATGSSETWDVLRIEAGWPIWGRELDENRFAVETGRIAQAISYEKGCYLGQEPIVMARDRGQVNRRLLGLIADGLIPVGSRQMKGEIEIARVTSSTFSPTIGKNVCLAYIYRGHQESGTVLTFAVDGVERTAAISALPLS